jgi:phosphoribosylformimino-5-aminoimidazole carboxamide ribotide isomerase
MRIIPVIDLLDGKAVHAVRGDRKNYRPLQSVLCGAPDPADLAGAFRDRLGLHEIYVADLNAIQGSSRGDHEQIITEMARMQSMEIILDTGVSDPDGARNWLDLGIHKVVIGAETLVSVDALQHLPASIGRDRLLFSLDMQAGKVLAPCADVAAMSPVQLLDRLRSDGWKEVILLDLERVGTEKGPIWSLAAKARLHFQEMDLLIGGGVSNFQELLQLQSMGLDGVLLATALHNGAIGAAHLAALNPPDRL